MGPLEQVKPWQTNGCKGIKNFLSRVWRLFIDADGNVRPFGKDTQPVKKALHTAIKVSTQGIEGLKFNTPISKMMEFVNICKGKTPSKESMNTGNKTKQHG